MKPSRNVLITIVIIIIILFVIYCQYQRKNSTPPVYYKRKLLFNYNGYNIPPFGIFIREDQRSNEGLLLHELVHWKQFQQYGLFPYLINYSKEAILHGYDKNIYEIEARFTESDYCKYNYTECVRSGLSNTVYNPNFRK